MRIEIFHASKYGNGAQVADELARLLAACGHAVGVHHMQEVKAKELPPAGLYIFGSPGRMGKPIGKARRFLSKISLPVGARYAIFSTEIAPQPDKKTGEMPTVEEIARWHRIQPIMDELLGAKGLKKAGAMKLWVTDMKGPLEDGWQKKVEEFAGVLAGEIGRPEN